ncbi:MAG: M23 family metallopeptidase [Bacteriovoracales bacterium]|nr:M23 family metallopeptidase [Bacteriovoracales bacterium]
MNRYYTIMIVPERDHPKTFRIPRFVYKSLAFMFILLFIVLGILLYDYYQIVQQVYQNKHLTIENRELREQVQVFQMKLNSLVKDINRIKIFEKKLKVVTGLDNLGGSGKSLEEDPDLTLVPPEIKKDLIELPSLESLSKDDDFQKLRGLYEQKIAKIFGMEVGYTYTKNWLKLTQRSFQLAGEFGLFDYKYDALKGPVRNLEVQIHSLDQFLLDKESMLRSTPSIFPTRGWITSYYGPRKSPHSGRKKMHEGLDIGGKTGTPILAPADGVISFSGHKAGFGKFVQIDHGYGLETIFGHAHKLFVREGEKVKRGKTIALLGSTGLSTGPHLHYEVRVNGIAVDPLYYILD